MQGTGCTLWSPLFCCNSISKSSSYRAVSSVFLFLNECVFEYLSQALVSSKKYRLFISRISTAGHMSRLFYWRSRQTLFSMKRPNYVVWPYHWLLFREAGRRAKLRTNRPETVRKLWNERSLARVVGCSSFVGTCLVCSASYGRQDE